jgi:peptidoglycan hydrolase CwlO-like protein
MAGMNARVHCRRIISALFLSALVASTSLVVVAVPRPAGADQISDLQAQAKQISQQLIEEQLQVGAYQQQYSVASSKVNADASAVAQTNQQIDQDQSQIDQKTSAVRRQAIRSYMDYGSGSSGPDSALFGGNQQTSQEAAEYDAIGVGNITTALDQLRTAQRTLQAHQVALRQQQAQDQSDQARQATTLNQANGSQQHLESLQNQVTGQLATAVAAQAAAQAQAAAAAVAAAQRAAAAKAPARPAPVRTAAPVKTAAPVTTATNSPTPTTGAPVTGGSDPALNPFLQCVVQAESGGNYGAVSPNGLYMGAFQFSQSTWNTAAGAAGRPDLIGVPPNTASKADQDTVAVALYALDGEQPWLGDRCSS